MYLGFQYVHKSGDLNISKFNGLIINNKLLLFYQARACQPKQNLWICLKKKIEMSVIQYLLCNAVL